MGNPIFPKMRIIPRGWRIRMFTGLFTGWETPRFPAENRPAGRGLGRFQKQSGRPAGRPENNTND